MNRHVIAVQTDIIILLSFVDFFKELGYQVATTLFKTMKQGTKYFLCVFIFLCLCLSERERERVGEKETVFVCACVFVFVDFGPRLVITNHSSLF